MKPFVSTIEEAQLLDRIFAFIMKEKKKHPSKYTIQNVINKFQDEDLSNISLSFEILKDRFKWEKINTYLHY